MRAMVLHMLGQPLPSPCNAKNGRYRLPAPSNC